MGEKLPLIFVPSAPESRNYKTRSIGGAGKKPLPSNPNPIQHVSKLEGNLKVIEKHFEDVVKKRKAAKLPKGLGTDVTFEVTQSDDLNISSFEDEKAGLRLLNFKPKSATNAELTVFVPAGGLEIFEKKFSAYRSMKTPKGKPKNRPFVESINQFRDSALEDLWTDAINDCPTNNEKCWWEIWLRKEVDVDEFRDLADTLGVQVGLKQLSFPERQVVLAHASRNEMTKSVQLLDAIAELRSPSTIDGEFTEFEHSEIQEAVADLAARIEDTDKELPRICILDTGVDSEHPLLKPFVREPDDLQSYDDEWSPHDDNGHGTEMAGFSVFGDKLGTHLAATSTLAPEVSLESVRILPPKSEADNDPKLYGEITLSSAAKVESISPDKDRAFSLSVTANDVPNGRPTSWSAAIDQLCSGSEEEAQPSRLVFISAGNVPNIQGDENYVFPATNETMPIQDPGQAWNAITVGAFTQKTAISEASHQNWRPVAPNGDLSPSSTTSILWDSIWPVKPDICCEGGNLAEEPESGQRDLVPSLQLVTTRRRELGRKLIISSGQTSAATACAANLAARIMAEVPDASPELIRALLVHSARWTPRMLDRAEEISGKVEKARFLLRSFGYGVPSYQRAISCLNNRVTLVTQNEIQPFVLNGSDVATNVMHVYKLPWPDQALDALGATDVRLRATLSYFVEPNPSMRGWRTKYSYASHQLRFDVKTARENEEQFLSRINKIDREAIGATGSKSDSMQWVLGEAIHRGSVHSDVWNGTAADLADKATIAIRPIHGWWFHRKSLGRVERSVPYALVVSIETDEVKIDIDGLLTPVDLYTPIVEKIQVPVEIES